MNWWEYMLMGFLVGEFVGEIISRYKSKHGL